MKSIKKWFKDNPRPIIFILLIFFVWQITIGIGFEMGQNLFSSTSQFAYSEGKCCLINPSWLWRRANFDGYHYLEIARKDYGFGQQAFFPLYPLIIRWLTPVFGRQDIVAGVFVSLLSSLLGLFILYKLVRLDFEEKIAQRTIIYLLIFPTAFFFSAVYNESLFFLLLVSSFYFAKKKQWWLAGITGALASATRLVGIFLFPALLIEWWQQRQTERPKDQKTKKQLVSKFLGFSVFQLIPLLFIPLGLILFIRFLGRSCGDPFAFIHTQPYFGAGREVGKIVLLYQVFWRYFKMLLTVDKFTHTYFVVVLEFLTAVLFLGLIILSYIRKWFSYFTFMVFAYITPTLTGTFLSLPRFALVLFPGFILLAVLAEKCRIIRVVYPIVAIGLSILCLIFFARGYWIA